MLLGMEEVMGVHRVDAILRLSPPENSIQDFLQVNSDHSFSFKSVSLLQSMLEQEYGPRGGRGLALRIGRVCFKYGLKEYGSMLGLTEMAFPCGVD